MSNIRLLADIHISPKTVADLQSQGFDIIRTSSILPANAPDIEILAFARRENRIIITQDARFFHACSFE